MKIIKIDKSYVSGIAPLIADFRVALDSYRGTASEADTTAAKDEFLSFLESGYPVFAAEDGGRLIGYVVCRMDEPCVWVEHLYVTAKYRRQGVASMLFEKAEEIAKSMGEDTVFNYVHPNNEGVIHFLRSKGYTVLNLIEVRKPYRGEKITSTIKVGENEFDY